MRVIISKNKPCDKQQSSRAPADAKSAFVTLNVAPLSRLKQLARERLVELPQKPSPPQGYTRQRIKRDSPSRTFGESQWSWRELNPRPKSSSTSDYKRSQSFGLNGTRRFETGSPVQLARANGLDWQSCLRRAGVSSSVATGVATEIPQLGDARHTRFGGARMRTPQI